MAIVSSIASASRSLSERMWQMYMPPWADPRAGAEARPPLVRHARQRGLDLRDLAAERRRRPPLSHHLGGHSLDQLREGAAVDHQRPQRVAHDVDEARADDRTAGIH